MKRGSCGGVQGGQGLAAAERGAAGRRGESPGISPSPQLRKGRRTRQVEHEREEEGNAYVDSVDSVEAKFQHGDGWRGVDGPGPGGSGSVVGRRLQRCRVCGRSHPGSGLGLWRLDLLHERRFFGKENSRAEIYPVSRGTEAQGERTMENLAGNCSFSAHSPPPPPLRLSARDSSLHCVCGTAASILRGLAVNFLPGVCDGKVT
jgi:hypothetical protein